MRRRADLDGSLTVFAAVDDEPAGAFLLQDAIRPDAPRMVRALRTAGITRVVLVTGDRADIADMIGRIVGVDTVLADCDPADKLAAIEQETANGPTIMVGDGVNDAPALAAAGVGVALAARGATASSEAADVVLTVDRIDALGDAILIARRSKKIALQAVLVGMGLSLVAMVAAAVGLLPPAAGAVVQEIIDVLAIGIALRAVLPGAVHTIAMPAEDIATAVRLRAEHDATLPLIEQIRSVADELSSHDCDLEPVRVLLGRLEGELLPHERADEELLVPLGRPGPRRHRRDRGDEPHPRGDRTPGLPAQAAPAGPGRGPRPTRGRDRTPPPALRALRRAPAAQRAGGRGRVQSRPRRSGEPYRVTADLPGRAASPTTFTAKFPYWRRSKCGQH